MGRVACDHLECQGKGGQFNPRVKQSFGTKCLESSLSVQQKKQKVRKEAAFARLLAACACVLACLLAAAAAAAAAAACVVKKINVVVSCWV